MEKWEELVGLVGIPEIVAVGAVVSMVHETVVALPVSCQFPAASFPITDTVRNPSASPFRLIGVATAISEE